jgi:hypothetical protein
VARLDKIVKDGVPANFRWYLSVHSVTAATCAAHHCEETTSTRSGTHVNDCLRNALKRLHQLLQQSTCTGVQRLPWSLHQETEPADGVCQLAAGNQVSARGKDAACLAATSCVLQHHVLEACGLSQLSYWTKDML